MLDKKFSILKFWSMGIRYWMIPFVQNTFKWYPYGKYLREKTDKSIVWSCTDWFAVVIHVQLFIVESVHIIKYAIMSSSLRVKYYT